MVVINIQTLLCKQIFWMTFLPQIERWFQWIWQKRPDGTLHGKKEMKLGLENRRWCLSCRGTREWWWNSTGWLLKLKWMGTQRVKMKGALPWLVRWAYRGGTRDFVLPWLLWSAWYKLLFSHLTLFQFPCPHHPGIWAGSLAESPVS